MNRRPLSPSRVAAACLVLATPPFLFTSCETAGPSVAVSGDLATPSHSLAKNEYPFDEKGNYREDWVSYGGSSTGSSKRSSSRSVSSSLSSSSKKREVEEAATSSKPAPKVTSTPKASSGSSSSASTAAPKVTATTETPKVEPTPPVPRKEMYHTVSSGETLWSISRKYGVSVTALKQENGLKTDVIRLGANLKIP